jgi:hypothetical protein
MSDWELMALSVEREESLLARDFCYASNISIKYELFYKGV